MELALLVLLFPAVLFVWGGVSVLVSARRSWRDPAMPRSVGVLRLVAGLGLFGAAVLSAGAFLGGELQYGIVGYPILACVLALLLITPLLLVARRREHRPQR